MVSASHDTVGHAISRQKTSSCIWVAIPVVELFYIGMPVVRTDGRKDGRTVTWRQVTSKSSRMHKDNQIFLPKVLRYKEG